MSVEERLPVHEFERMRGRELRSLYVRAIASWLIARLTGRQAERVAAILEHAKPERPAADPPRSASIGARWHRW